MHKISILAVVVTAACVLVTGPSAADTQTRSEITVRSSPYGRIVFDGRGFALYAFTKDAVGRGSTCAGPCARAWPPYTVTGTQRRARGLDPGKLGTIRRGDGRRQLTLAGRPLYYYVGDRAPLQVLCQNVREFGGLWLVVKPTGALLR